MKKEERKRGCLRAGAVWGARVILVLLLLATAVLGLVFRKPLYNRFRVFPQQQKAWEEIRAARVEPSLKHGWNEYRGVMHSHTSLSHDCTVSPEEILNVLKTCDLDFIFTSDHYVDGAADYELGWKGLHDGKLFVRGYEMKDGFMPWAMPDDTVFRAEEDSHEVARKIGEAGGLLFYAHCEESRLWHLPELTGIEIYNIHVDFKDEEVKELIPNLVLSMKKYPDQTMRLIFDRPTPFLERLDLMNRGRKIVGIGANDAHQNLGLKFIYTQNHTLLIRETGGDSEKFDVKEYELSGLSRLALRIFFGPLEPGKILYRIDLDPYDVSARYVNTHILAAGLSEEQLAEALRAGRVFVAFDMIADARGFVWMATGPNGQALIGETVAFEPSLKLQAAAPHESRFTVVRDGQQVAQAIGYACEFIPPGPGKYRVEAELNIRGTWTPWVYTNYLEIRSDIPELPDPPERPETLETPEETLAP